MKKTCFTFIVCFLFLMLSFSIGSTFALKNEKIKFIYNNKVFVYNLSSNIKYSSQFDINFHINKYERFSNSETRKKLLKHLININLAPNIAINYLFPNLENTVKTISKNIYVKAKNASISINPNTEQVFKISPEIIGKQVDTNKLYIDICNKYLNSHSLQIEIPIISTPPEICKKDFENQINLRADFSTNISSSSTDRKHNIKTALNSINKKVLLPNETFSFNNVVGRRTENNGYRTAKIIVNNEFVDGIGGGVCQVSSTLYNAALLSGLEIVEANKHSKQVGYVKYGFDAMVNFGSSDLKFKNNTNDKITIIANYSQDKIRIRIFGKSLNNTQYKLTNEIENVVDPIQNILIDTNEEYIDKVKYTDEYFYLKQPAKGMTIKSYREKFVNNNLVLKELIRTDKYSVQDATIVYGAKIRDE